MVSGHRRGRLSYSIVFLTSSLPLGSVIYQFYLNCAADITAQFLGTESFGVQPVGDCVGVAHMFVSHLHSDR